jgi:hypothetical protein
MAARLTPCLKFLLAAAVISLYSMLEHMAKEFDNERRLSELREARRWLSEFLRSGHQNESGKIYLQTLGSLNEEQN